MPQETPKCPCETAHTKYGLTAAQMAAKAAMKTFLPTSLFLRCTRVKHELLRIQAQAKEER